MRTYCIGIFYNRIFNKKLNDLATKHDIALVHKDIELIRKDIELSKKEIIIYLGSMMAGMFIITTSIIALLIKH